MYGITEGFRDLLCDWKHLYNICRIYNFHYSQCDSDPYMYTIAIDNKTLYALVLWWHICFVKASIPRNNPSRPAVDYE